jgi:hypothetical protein
MLSKRTVKTVRFFLPSAEKSVKRKPASTTSCGHPKEDWIFYKNPPLFFVVPGKNLWYNDSK